MNDLPLSSIHLISLLLTYAIYSTVSLLGVAALTRCCSPMTSELRCLLWKWAILIPLPLTAVATQLPDFGWVPRIELQSATASDHDGSYDEATSFRERQRSVHAAADIRAERTSSAMRLTEFGDVSSTPATATPATFLERLGTSEAFGLAARGWSGLAILWIGGVGIGLLRLLSESLRIEGLRKRSRPVVTGNTLACLDSLRRRSGITRRVELRVSTEIDSPLTGGVWKPFILVPPQLSRQLSGDGQEAILAHELAHVVRRDVAWNFVSLLLCRCGFFQPLNLLARRELQAEAEFLADRWAAQLLNDRVQIARCLAEVGEWLLHRRAVARTTYPLAVGVGSFRSGLGRRVAALLQDCSMSSGTAHRMRVVAVFFMVGCSCGMLCLVPRASAEPAIENAIQAKETEMKPILSTVAVLSGLALGPVADAQVDSQRTEAAAATPIAVPQELQEFSGMLIGKMVSRDIERGEFTVTIDHVARVWENNKARQPRAAVGKTLTVENVTGKWLDQLLLIRPGETVEFEAQHRGGDRLRFPGEWLHKVPPFDPADHPVPPEAFRGFAGIVDGKIERRRDEGGELVLRVNRIHETFERNRAENPEAIVGKEIVLAGFWGRMRKPFDQLKPGDTVRTGVVHRVPQSDHFTVAEFIEKSAESDRPAESNRPARKDREESREADASGFPAGMRGFRGILRGTVVSRDVEKGELVFRAQRATRVWKQNKATDVESCAGRTFTTEGISGKWLDVLLTLEPGDAIEVEAFHNRGERLDFVGEWLKKVE